MRGREPNGGVATQPTKVRASTGTTTLIKKIPEIAILFELLAFDGSAPTFSERLP